MSEENSLKMCDTIDSIMFFCNRLESFFVKYSYLIKKLSKLDVIKEILFCIFHYFASSFCCYVEVCDILYGLPFRSFLSAMRTVFAYFAFLASNCGETRIFLCVAWAMPMAEIHIENFYGFHIVFL